MRIEIRDPVGMFYSIDSLQPDLLGKWLLETFARIGPMGPGLSATAQVWPSYSAQSGQADYAADSRVLGQLTKVANAREVLQMMSATLDEAERLQAAGEGPRPPASGPGPGPV